MFYNTQLNPMPYEGEVNNMPSMTVPDMSYSISDLLRKFTAGQVPTDFLRAAYFTDTDDFDEFIETELPDFDLADYTVQEQRLRETFEQIRGRVNSQSVETPTQPTQSDSVKEETPKE